MIAVIGDVHGCFLTLVKLFNKIRISYPHVPIYCVGDLVDRGNNSYDVLRFMIDERINFTAGNHDYMFYDFFKDPSSNLARTWVFNGNEATIESYEEHNRELYLHLDHIKKTPFFYDLDDCFISHAGISEHYRRIIESENYSSEILSEVVNNNFRNDDGVLWARGALLNIGKLQVVGHTKNKDVTFDESSNTVYIDTGACVGNKLSAVVVHQHKIIETLEEKTHLNDII
ncbi:MAG: metallophosphoesterase [Melioribacteraceae bacterium]|nr:metallophosphoesterase [Melioribacteraceae bacterium]